MEKIGNINIDFDIFSLSPKNLIVGDASDWIYAKNKPSYITVTLPGSSKSKNFTFKKSNLNRFNSHNLGLSCLSGDCTEEVYINLPDGIYTICVKSSYEGIENTKFFLKTDLFEQEFNKVIIKEDLYSSDQKTDFLLYMMEIQGILRVAKAWASEGDFVKANRHFQHSKEMLSKYLDCKNCI